MPQIQFIAGAGGHLRSQQRRALFSHGGGEGVCSGFFPHFPRSLLVVLELRQFLEPSTMKSSSSSRAHAN